MIMMKKRLFLKLMAVAMLLSTALQVMAQKEFYGVQSSGETWTYYYDTQKTSRGGISLPGDGLLNTPNTVTVVFDASVADYRPKSMTSWFNGCTELTTITGMQYLNTSNVWLMNTMFTNCSSLKSIDLSHFDTSKVSTMVAMFEGCSSLTKLDLTNFDTSNVTNMEGMFAYCSSLTTVDLSSFNTAKVTNMSGMFAFCENLSTVYADDARWTTAAVTDSPDVFYNCGPLVGGNGTSYYDSFIEDESYARVDKAGQPGYFTQKDGPAIATPEPYAVLSDDDTVLTFYYDGNKSSRSGLSIGTSNSPSSRGWNEADGNITTVIFDESFANCTTLTSTCYWFINFSKLTSIIGIENLKTPNVTDMSYMFYGCSKLESLDVSHFDTKNVTNMENMFCQCSSLTTLNVSNLNVGKVTTMYGMFANCSKLESLDLSSFITTSVVDMSVMFWGCSGLKSIDVSSFDTSNVTNMRGMFTSCSGLSELDLTNFNTVKVTNMDSMFEKCSGLTNLDLSSFKVEKVTTMWSMFMNCSSLTTLDLSNFFTESLTRTEQMFLECTNLVSVDVRNFDTRNITSARIMFGRCPNLTTIYCDNTWGITSANSPNMFYESTKLPGFNSNYVNATKAKPIADGGYFTPTNAGLTKCAKPVISYVNGKLSFSCETEGVEFVYNVTMNIAKSGTGNEVELIPIAIVSVYATKDGFENSETVTQEIDLRGLKGDTNDDAVVDIADAVQIVNLIVGKIDTLARQRQTTLQEPE
jgi:surface protein